MANKIILPVAFSEPMQLLLFTRYGDPRTVGWEERWMTEWNVRDHFPGFPERHLFLHKHFKLILENALRELDILGLMHEIKAVKKCHFKSCDEKGVLSAHYWGTAIDLLPRHHLSDSIEWSHQFLSIMQDNAISCGQHTSTSQKHAHRFSMIEMGM